MDTYELINDSAALRPALPKTFWWALGSIVLMPVGAFGPWAKLLGVLTIRGTDDNAGWTVVGSAAIAAIGLGSFVRWRRRWLCIVPLLAAAAGAATAAYNIRDISSLNTSFDGADLVSTEWGIYVALVGSISLLLASLVLGVQTKSTAERVAIPGSTATAKLRSPWGVFLLATVTFGVYGLCWYYQANRELKDYGVGSSPLRSLLAQFPGALLIVPPFVSWWRFFGRILEAEDRAGCSGRVDHAVGFVLYLIAFFLLPFELVYVQQHLNELWRRVASAAPAEEPFTNPAPIPQTAQEA
jgi:Domain of unknown function (DUF4234)